MTLDKDTVAKVLAANYAAAAALLQGAESAMREAADAAERGENNLAVGTAMEAEHATKKALRLIEAAATIRAA